jgi:hypothetical protein
MDGNSPMGELPKQGSLGRVRTPLEKRIAIVEAFEAGGMSAPMHSPDGGAMRWVESVVEGADNMSTRQETSGLCMEWNGMPCRGPRQTRPALQAPRQAHNRGRNPSTPVLKKPGRHPRGWRHRTGIGGRELAPPGRQIFGVWFYIATCSTWRQPENLRHFSCRHRPSPRRPVTHLIAFTAMRGFSGINRACGSRAGACSDPACVSVGGRWV